MAKAKVETAVKRSRTGVGLFTKEDLPKGIKIIQYTGEIISNEEVERHVGRYLFKVDEKHTIDGRSRANKARYVNHSCRPNAEAEINKKEIWILSKRRLILRSIVE